MQRLSRDADGLTAFEPVRRSDPRRQGGFRRRQRAVPASSELAEGLRNHDALFLELSTYFDGQVYFEFDLRGGAELYERHCPNVDWDEVLEGARDPSSTSVLDQAEIDSLIEQSRLAQVESAEEQDSSTKPLLAPTD